MLHDPRGIARLPDGRVVVVEPGPGSITAIDGRKPADPRTLRNVLAEREPGDVISLSVHDMSRVRVASTHQGHAGSSP